VSKIPWYVARSSGIVAWALIVATIVWGLLLATKVLGRRPAPAWLLSLHRYLGALTIAFVGVHVGALLLDTYTNFGISEVLVPFTGSWHPAAVAWGIVGMYLLAAIEITSLVRRRLSKRAWHGVHLLSYFLFATTTVHMLTAGTDVKALVASTAAAMLGIGAVFGSAALYVWRSDPGAPRAARIAASSGLDRDPRGASW
jgi:DMSO/TMAO reductase YedYZ heme-binding membrane subunit